MTQSQKALGYVSLVVLVWALVGVMLRSALEIAAAAGSELSLPERAFTSAYLFGLRYLPLMLAPALLAPVAVIWFWLVPRTRSQSTEASAEERRQLGHWLLWVAAAAAAMCGSVFLGADVRTNLQLWGLGAITWAYAGALYRAFRLQGLRLAAGDSKVSSVALALTAALTLFVPPTGVAIPVWVFWASRMGARRPTSA